MPVHLTVTLERPIASVQHVHGRTSVSETENATVDDSPRELEADVQLISQGLLPELEEHKQQFIQANRTLESVLAELERSARQLYVQHKDEIAELSVEIARRVLSRQIADGDYEIEAIIKETLKDAPTAEDLTVRLNPEDLALLQSARQKSEQDTSLHNARLVADAQVGKAECVVESPKGAIESRINEQLERIAKALKKAHQQS